MLTVRLSKEMELQISKLTEKKNITKSELVKEALQMYIAKNEKDDSPYTLGKELFGNFGSGNGNLSIGYKYKV